MRCLRQFLLVVASLVMFVMFVMPLACTTFGATDTPTPAANEGGAAETSTETSTEASTPSCNKTALTVVEAVGDTTIFRTPPGGVCPGTTSYGAAADVKLTPGNGLGLFRFELPAPAVNAIANHKVITVRLVVETYPNCTNCGAGMPVVGGTLTAHLMRSDWTEGTSADNSGADFCRRGAGDNGPGWGTDLVSSSGSVMKTGRDYSSETETVDYADDALSVNAPVPTGTLEQWLTKDGALSVLLEVVTPGSKLVLAAREAPKTKPRLEVTGCLD